MLFPRPFVPALLLCIGCAATDTGTEPASGDSDSGGSTSGATSTSAAGADASTSGAEATSGAESTSGVEATSEASSGGGSSTSGATDPCPIDLLLVVDNSGSMVEEQSRLSAALPNFVGQLEQLHPGGTSLHAMVVDSDAYPYAPCVEPCAAAERADCFDERGICSLQNPDCQLVCSFLFACAEQEFECGTQPAACEDVLGAGVIDPSGPDTPRGDCGIEGQRFVDSDDPGYLDQLSCATRVGTSSMVSPERPMDAMLAAVSSVNRETMTCNAGFARDEAGLVVVFVTDENDDVDDGSSGSPSSWRLGLLAAKGGEEDRVVVTGIFGDNDVAVPVCTPLDDAGGGAEPAPRLREFVESFGEHGVVGSVCETSFEDVLTRTAAAASVLCER